MVKADPDAELRPGNGAAVKSPRRTLRKRMPAKVRIKRRRRGRRQVVGWPI